MPNCILIDIGGITISLSPSTASGNYQLPEFITQFSTTLPPQVELNIQLGSFPNIDNQHIIFETVQGWRLLKSGTENIISLTQRGFDPYLVGCFSSDYRSGDIHVAQVDQKTNTYAFPLSYPMGELLLMNLLGSGLGMLFHASGVIHQGEGFLFTGHGGVGKTTTARLWANLPGAKVVNDDKVIVRQENGIFWMYGTPWPGEGKMALPEKAPLNRVFILKQAQKNSVEATPPATAVGMLLARSFMPLWDQEKVSESLSFLDKLVHAVPCQEYGFIPDMSAVDYVLTL